MEWAGTQALRERHALGSRSTLATRIGHWRLFCSWIRDRGIKDARDIDEEHLLEYGAWLRGAGKSVSYAVNLVSSTNSALCALGSTVWVRPSVAVGQQRDRVRRAPPAAMDRGRVQRAVSALRESGEHRAAALLLLVRHAGLRLREASLADLHVWCREMQRYGRINVQKGTKGGRRAPRWVSVGPELRDAILFALEVAPARNLLSPQERSIDWLRTTVKRARRVLKAHGLPGYHDSRAAWACDRYLELTGMPAPVVVGVRLATRDADRRARDRIGYELGHGRRDVVGAYCGSSR